MAEYAKQTSVSPEKSRAEIERTLARWGASSFAYMTEPGRAAIAFIANGKQVRFVLPLPTDPNEFMRTEGKAHRVRTHAQRQAALEQAIRQKWRALALSIKAKLEAVESGIVTFEEEFLAHFVLPSGETVGQRLAPEIKTLGQRELPALMPGAGDDGGTVLDG